MLDFLPQWFQIFFSMVPWLEARYVIPFALLQYGWEWWQASPFTILGDNLLILFIFLFFNHVEKSAYNLTWTYSNCGNHDSPYNLH